MAAAPAPLLDRQNVFASRDAERTRAFLHDKEFRFELAPRDSSALDVRINGVYLPGIFIGCIGYGAPVSVAATPARDDYWIQVPIAGAIETTTGRHSLACDSRRGAVCAPQQENLLRTSAGNVRFNVALQRAAVHRQLAALLGCEPRSLPEFEPEIDLTSGYGRSLVRQLHYAAAELDCADSALWQPRAMARFEDLLVTSLLLSHPHSASAALERLDRPLAPRDVKRAVDFMHEHLDGDLTLVDIVAAAGVPGRTLFKHFRDVHGASPMRYLKHARLDRLRVALSSAEPGQTVGALALRHGFTHMGRLSIDYRRRFGESPSRTLRRAAR